MNINCPVCGTSYDIDESKLPESPVKVKCRVCSNVFTLSKTPNEEHPQLKIESASSANNFVASAALKSGAENTDGPASDGRGFKDARSAQPAGAAAAGVSSAASPASSASPANQSAASKNKPSPRKKARAASRLGTAMLIVLLILILIAAVVLAHYRIINIPFLPRRLSSFSFLDAGRFIYGRR